MTKGQIEWSNESVLRFAGGTDPVSKMESLSRATVLQAVEMGWQGPPFDPIELAKLQGIIVRPNASIADARVFFDNDSFQIEYNPNRPKARVNFSIAHEIAHTFFEDCAEIVRYRSREFIDHKGWQLEMLCNIGAAEILMPAGSFSEGVGEVNSIERLMELRKIHQVSAEAVLIRFAKLATSRIACFSASRFKSDGSTVHRIDYCIGSQSWGFERFDGATLANSRVLQECVAIGSTSKGVELWQEKIPELHIEAVALPPYPDSSELRVVGYVRPAEVAPEFHELMYRQGDATEFVKPGNSAIVHIVNDRARNWGGLGFAGALKRKHSIAYNEYGVWAADNSTDRKLGTVHIARLPGDQFVVSLVAQSGYGASKKPRLRYSALDNSLNKTAQILHDLGVKYVQMPKIGTGQAGGNWSVIEGIIQERLVSIGFEVRVFDLPPR
jgi:O-acetyl-ADP-ribose deacetylase (regulator of RNase III)